MITIRASFLSLVTGYICLFFHQASCSCPLSFHDHYQIQAPSLSCPNLSSFHSALSFPSSFSKEKSSKTPPSCMWKCSRILNQSLRRFTLEDLEDYWDGPKECGKRNTDLQEKLEITFSSGKSSPYIKAWPDNKVSVLEQRADFQYDSSWSNFLPPRPRGLMMESPRRQGLNVQTERMKLNMKTEERSPHIREEHEVVSTYQRSSCSYRGPVGVSALYNVQPPWQEAEAGNDRRGFPNICPKAPEGSWHLLHLLHQKQQSQGQTILCNQSREYGKPVWARTTVHITFYERVLGLYIFGKISLKGI